MRAVSVLGLALALAGCGAGGEASPVHRPAVQAGIKNGVSAADSAVVRFQNLGTPLFCNGVLITPTVVLTLGICLDLVFTWDRVAFGDDNSTMTYVGLLRTGLHPGSHSHGYYSSVGLVEIDAPAPMGVTPIQRLPVSAGLTEADQGRTVRMVGMGVDQGMDSGVLRSITATIVRVCEGPDPCHWMGNYFAPGQFAIDGSAGGMCSSDDGSPVLIERAGIEYVAGILTRHTSSDCLGVSIATQVDAYEDFIQSFISGTPFSYPPRAGQPCLYDYECGRHGHCASERENAAWVGGYCLGGCLVTPCAGDGLCLPSGTAGFTGCFDGCVTSTDCRSGYDCVDSGSGMVCAPAGAPFSAPLVERPNPVGDPCTLHWPCYADRDGLCLNEAKYPQFWDGYCVTFCQPACPGDSICIPGASGDVCWDACTSDADCRVGYRCETYTEGDVCFPDPALVRSTWAGAACASDAECLTGDCATEAELGVTGGACVGRCTNDPECGAFAVCVEGECRARCNGNDDCRDEFVCEPVGAGSMGSCVPHCDLVPCAGGDPCNVYGLCGEALPVGELGSPEIQPAPDCGGAECKDEGCAQVTAGGWWMVMALLCKPRVRRKRR